MGMVRLFVSMVCALKPLLSMLEQPEAINIKTIASKFKVVFIIRPFLYFAYYSASITSASCVISD